MHSPVPADRTSHSSSPKLDADTDKAGSIDTVLVNNEKIMVDETNGDDDTSNVKEAVPYKSTPDNGDDFKEERYAWLIVLGAFFVQVTSFGVVTSWGVMQDYFHEHRLGLPPPSETTLQMENEQLLNLSFVGTIALICTNICGPLAQILTSIWGHRIVLIIGTFCVTIGLICAGFATEIWHLYLTQGIVFGLGACLNYCTIMGVAPLWFNKRRGLALGVVTSGSGIGGLIIPFIMTSINETPSLGPEWTYRILGFICLALDLVAVVFVRPRVPTPRQRKKLGDIIKLNVLKDMNFLLFLIGSSTALMGYFLPYFFLPAYATSIGLSPKQGGALVAVSSAMNFLGRILAGISADRIGKLNTNILFTTASGLSTFLIWTFAKTYGVLMAYSAVFGLFCGSYFALLSPITAQILGNEKFPTGLSVMLLSNVVSVFGPNIASAIQNAVNTEPFLTYKLFAGAAFLVGALILMVLKIKLDRNILAKV